LEDNLNFFRLPTWMTRSDPLDGQVNPLQRLPSIRSPFWLIRRLASLLLAVQPVKVNSAGKSTDPSWLRQFDGQAIDSSHSAGASWKTA
jgi:hypothetical protein